MTRFIPPAHTNWANAQMKCKSVPKVPTGIKEIPAIPSKKARTDVASKVNLYARIGQLEAIKNDKGQLMEMISDAEKSYGVNFFNSAILDKLAIASATMIAGLPVEDLYKLVLFISENVVIREPAESNISEYKELSLSERVHLIFYIRQDDPPLQDGERPLYIKTFSMGCNDYDEMLGYLSLLNGAEDSGIKVAAPRTNNRKSRTEYEYELKGWVNSLKWKEAMVYLTELAELLSS